MSLESWVLENLTFWQALYGQLCLICNIPGKPWKPGILSFTFQVWKMSGMCSKVGKSWNFNSKLWKYLKFVNLVSTFTFQDVIYPKQIFDIFVISTLSTQTLIQSQIDLGFDCFSMEITWKIHGILGHQRRGDCNTHKKRNIPLINQCVHLLTINVNEYVLFICLSSGFDTPVAGLPGEVWIPFRKKWRYCSPQTPQRTHRETRQSHSTCYLLSERGIKNV